MKESVLVRCLALAIAFASIAIARGDIAQMVTTSTQAQSSGAATQTFTQIDGVDLNARLEAARTRGRTGSGPYWSAWAFDVRPGVAVDPNIREFHGSINTMGDTSLFVGTSADGQPVETRNLGIFVLRDPGSTQVSRIEVYNLERKREYAGYPVYWLGRSNNEESLNFLRPIVETNVATTLTDRAVLAIALHDDARVPEMLRDFVRKSTLLKVRSSAVYWLGQNAGQQAFLSDIVRDTGEDIKLRQRAAYAVGESRDRAALATVQSLYDSVNEKEIRRSLIRSVNGNQDKDGALAFIMKVARTDTDRESRRTAIRTMGEFDRDTVVDELMKFYANDTDIEIKRAVLQSMADMKNPRAQARLLEVARSDANGEMRRQAVRSISQRGEVVTDELLRLYDAEQIVDVKRSILQSLSEIKSPRVEDKLFQVASSDANVELRRQAIRQLGERAGQRALKFLSDTVDKSDENTEVQLQAVRAISERSKDESVPILIRIARTHPNQSVRRLAMRELGESGDPRAIDFFREVLAKE